MPSERDQNFEILTPGGDRFVLKLSQTNEDRALLECQHEVFERLASARDGHADDAARPQRSGTTAPATGVAPFRCPRARPAHSGTCIERVPADGGEAHFVRLLEWVPGRPLATVRPHSPALLEEVGSLLATIDRELADFSHQAARRPLHWDLRQSREVIERHLPDIADGGRRARVTRFLPMLDASVELFARLRTSVIHGDGNDWNILVAEPDPRDPFRPQRVAGIVDFGDMLESWTIGDLAIACAYCMLGKRDPLAAASHVVRGYHAVYTIPENEIEAIFPLISARLCTSVVLAAWQRQQRPDNEYLSISEAPAWELLERLGDIHPRYAHYTFRCTCGLAPCPATARVTAWLSANQPAFGPVLGTGPTATQPGAPDARDLTALDLSAASVQFPDAAGPFDVRAWTDAIVGAIRAAGARVAVGRYDEARAWYAGDPFRVETDDAPEQRTVHLGIDLFAEAGTPVFAPFDGEVESLRDNAQPSDYGPTLILTHETGDGLRFHTLWGHLTRETLEGTRAGVRVRKGERIGAVGDATVNGGWPPHLHLQLIMDLLDRSGEFPGVARPRDRDVWLSLSPDPNLVLGLPHATTAGADSRLSELQARRAAVVGPSLSIAYQRPLVIVRGWMQHLYDELGQPYLDAVNNVAHVGHSHPRVVEAIRRQSAVLNTNTRYLHENLVRYAERLTATLPEPLRVCFFVCSGSEANELALRLARAHTGRRDVIVLDAAYHGNTSSLIEISPYKWSDGAAAHVHVVPLPDPYRGLYRGTSSETGRRYAQHVRETCERLATAGRGAGVFFAEPLPGCGGQIVPPAGFLARAFEYVREAGGVCVADEVQTGLGRVGSEFWAFAEQGALPDIVTIGKPIGNGHPIGAVITTSAIAKSFDTGMEYFNTFGGNPVSCAAGMAVLDVIEEEGLQANARRVGERMMAGLRELMARHAIIGDVRGRGLYIGVELVRDRTTREPAGLHASWAVNRMRELGILISTDGPDHNVLKIKPPLVFTAADADRLVETLDRVLAEDALRVS
jgi:4-aminobutyrate aminotransferase-like enzyme/Ser/Thr protein kinase RdoA (MazF antagonist)